MDPQHEQNQVSARWAYIKHMSQIMQSVMTKTLSKDQTKCEGACLQSYNATPVIAPSRVDWEGVGVGL